MRQGERQVAPALDGIRRDHVARYEFAARRLPKASSVIDIACGVGYGAFVLAAAGHEVLAVDRDEEALAYAADHYAHKHVRLHRADAGEFRIKKGRRYDSAVCFETIEHLADPLPMLRSLRREAMVLIASVPNEEKFPYRGYAFHHRHYTRAEFEQLLNAAGWRAAEWWGQEGPESDVERNLNGRTVIVVAKRGAVKRAETGEPEKVPAPPAASAPAASAKGAVPNHVVILGLGPSLESYVDLVKRLGSRRRLADEVWAINALGDVLQCDRIFHMDDLRIQEIRAAAIPDSNISEMIAWMKKHPGPIYTSRAYPEYPGTVEFPFEAVINSLGYAYFNNTAPYAIAYAVYLGVKKISLFGCDYTYRNAHDAEKGRACAEFWLGIAAARGIALAMSDKSSLMDACEPDDLKHYGYGRFGTRDVTITPTDSGLARVSFAARDKLPSAPEIEEFYDHSNHPSPLVHSSPAREGEKA